MKLMQKILSSKVRFLFIIFFLSTIILMLNIQSAEAKTKKFPSRKKKKTVENSVSRNFTIASPKIQSASAIAVDYDDSIIYFDKNAHQQRSIASLTKMMAMIVLSDIKFDPFTIYTIPRYHFRPCFKTRLKPGMQVTAMDLMHSALLGSDNVATLCLVDISGLTQYEFVNRMNEYARKMNLRLTHFADPTGIEPENVSTAYEVSLMLKRAIETPMIYRLMNTKSYRLSPINHYNDIQYTNTNRLLQNPEKHTFGGKTGFISVAGYCLATANTLDSGKRTLMIFLGANGKLTRFGDASRLIDWLNNNISKISRSSADYAKLTE